jgi:deoxyribonuclease V
MHLALDVHYGAVEIRGACVGFEHNKASEPAFLIVDPVEGIADPYEPGNFRKRELPYLERLVDLARKQCSEIETIIIDGYVWLGMNRPGLGYHLYESLNHRGSIIGAAKKRFQGRTCRGGQEREQRRATIHYNCRTRSTSRGGFHCVHAW